MFGLSFEKLLLVAVLAAVVLGPQRLPVYAAKLARLVRSLRRLLDTAKQNAEADLGVPLDRSAYQIDLRRYDPRAIVRDAMREPRATPLNETDPDHVEAHAHASSAAPAPKQSVPAPRPVSPPATTPTEPPGQTSTTTQVDGNSVTSHTTQRDNIDDQAEPTAAVVRHRWVVTGGSSGHPRRVLITEPLEHDLTPEHPVS